MGNGLVTNIVGVPEVVGGNRVQPGIPMLTKRDKRQHRNLDKRSKH